MKLKLHGKVNNEDIDRAINDVNLFLQKNGAGEKISLASRIVLEEVMLSYQERIGETKDFEISLKKNRKGIRCLFRVSGSCVDPELYDSVIIQGIRQSVCIPLPEWHYKDGQNCVLLSIPLYNDNLKNFKFVWKYAQRCQGLFYLAVGTQFVSLVLSVIAPILSAKIIVSISNSAVDQIIRMGIVIVAVDVFTDIANYFCSTRYNMVYNKIVSEIEYDLAKSTLNITNSCIEEKGSGLFIRRLTVDTETLATSFNTLADFIIQIIRNLGVLAAMMIISPLIFVIVLVLFAAQTYIEVLRTKRMTTDDRLFRVAHERFSGFVSEMVRGTADIKMLNAEEPFKKEMLTNIRASNDSHMDMILTTWRYKLGRWGIADISKLVVLFLLGTGIAASQLDPANALVLYNYTIIIIGGNAVLLFGEFLEFLKSFNLSTERICAVLNSPEFPKDRFGKKHLDSVRGELSFEHVSFRYESTDLRYKNRIVLKDICFDIPAGSTVALVGRSGCGKTTIFRLICKLNETIGGAVYLDGTNIKDLDKDSLRGSISVVTQNPYIFHMSIRKNLQMVKPDLTEDEMREVCRIACIADDIERMPQKYDSIIGEGGINLSGGQRQRLAIARCLLRNPAVMLLDEATSALDNVTQAEIMKGLHKARHNRTLVMIAHRLSTVVNADMILLIDEGKVIDKGTHKELLDRCDAYRELYETEDQAYEL